EALAVQADDAVVVVSHQLGQFGDVNGPDVVTRFDADGTPDDEFGTSGRATVDGVLEQLIILPSGAIVGIGSKDRAGLVVRLTPAGQPDPGFGGGDGRVDIPSDFPDGFLRLAGGFTTGDQLVVVGNETPKITDPVNFEQGVYAT